MFLSRRERAPVVVAGAELDSTTRHGFDAAKPLDHVRRLVVNERAIVRRADDKTRLEPAPEREHVVDIGLPIAHVNALKSTCATTLDLFDLLLPSQRLAVRCILPIDAVSPGARSALASPRAHRADAKWHPRLARRDSQRQVREESLLMTVAAE